MNAVSDFFSDLGATAKSLVKIALQSRPVKTAKADDSDKKPLIILANGPSLRRTIEDYGDQLLHYPTLAVNFAANAPEFRELKPKYYVLADPHFFRAKDDENVSRLLINLSAVTWPMRLFVDRRFKSAFAKAINLPQNVTLEGFNAVGAEGFAWFERLAYRSGLTMPRPRNVLIPSIMIGIRLGYRDIYICGADHSWMRDIAVTDDNVVVSGMTHFYEDSSSEVQRARSEYRDYRIHPISNSYYVAFLSLHKIRRYADTLGIRIINSTPGSYIDAFPRSPLPK